MLCRLEAAGKRYRFRGPWALRDCTLELRAGSIVEISGPDGAGKSTLLALIAGSQELTTGTIWRGFDGGQYVPEDLPSGLLLSAETYLRNMGTAAGRPLAEANDRVHTLSWGLGLGDVLRRPLGTLPAWASPRVALCRALAHPGRMIVLDDPWTGLDPDAARFLVGELEARRADGACIVVTDEGPRPDGLTVDERYELSDGALAHTHGLA